MMRKKLISVAAVLVMLCLSFAGCGCEAGTPTTLDSDAVAEQKINELMNDFKDALNNRDEEAYESLTTDKFRDSDSDINKYFDQIKEFILKEIAFDSRQQNGTTYEMLVHYYITFSSDYTGTQYKAGISNMTDRFVFVKEGDAYKIDVINKFGQ